MKPTRIALYELMSRDSAARAPKPPDDEQPRRSWRSSAGRTIRVPVGYLWLAGAGGLVLLIGAFSTGFVRGQYETTARFEREWLETRQPTLAVPPPEIKTVDQLVRTETSPGLETRAVADPPVRPHSPADRPGRILSDPRVKGLNYFILIHTHRKNAEELAVFCRQEGVEAYAVPDKRNKSLYRVLVLPGYAKGQRSSAPVRALEQRITDATRKWKLQRNPRDELGYYPERFGG